MPFNLFAFYFHLYAHRFRQLRFIHHPTRLTEAGEIAAIARDARLLATAEIELRGQFPDPFCGEMLTRWDMVSAPPDILITNTSMLNVMLMRDVEDPIFEKTRSWLAESDDNCFSLIVDELHSYRGTQGTEITLVVRSLLDRLGLEPHSPQLRCLATSASIDGEEGREYLEQFFGVDRATFEIFPGEPLIPEAQVPVDQAVVLEHAPAINAGEPGAARPLLDRFSARRALAVATIEAGALPNGGHRPARISRVSEALLGPDAPAEAFEAILRAAEVEEQDSFEAPTPSFRVHMFVRQIQGMWACSNPGCDQAADEYRSEDRAIGRLFKLPRVKCDCGGQVLELLYCYDCGEMYLGGFVTPLPAELENDGVRPGPVAGGPAGGEQGVAPGLGKLPRSRSVEALFLRRVRVVQYRSETRRRCGGHDGRDGNFWHGLFLGRFRKSGASPGFEFWPVRGALE